jgi:hypothetical protein
MSYLYVKWNSFGRGLLASGLAIKACLCLRGHSRNGGLRRRRRRAQAAIVLTFCESEYRRGPSSPLDNQYERCMLPLVAKGKKVLCQTSRVISSRAL